jgi:SpoVK/Ycf46/Vps4 family AAA+-type ATPase
VLGAFLTWLAEKRSPVFVVATANDVTRLPPELLRRGRFDELFFVDLPTQRERAEILAVHLRKHHRDPKLFRLDELATAAERMTGAELEQAVVSGLHAAFSASRELTSDDVANALTQTVPLYETYEERIKELRDWARTRARSASNDSRVLDLFA